MKVLPLLALFFGTFSAGSAHAVLTGKCTAAGCMQIPAENSDSERADIVEQKRTRDRLGGDASIPAGVENTDQKD